jgi:hypothetical protein
MLWRTKCLFVFLVFGFFFVLADSSAKSVIADTTSFVLVKEDNGIALYERWYSIKPTQRAREIKATFKVKAHGLAAVDLIRDESQGRKWNRNTEAYKVIPENDNFWFGYIQYDLPWPVSDQDCVLQYNKNLSGNSLLIEFKGAQHPSFPVQKRIERIGEINGKWIFTEQEGEVFVEYYISTTPSSTLPTWLTDPFIRNNLIETLLGFRQILEHQKT